MTTTPTGEQVRFICQHEGPDKVPSMPGCHGMLGWKEFLQNRSDILTNVDRAKVLGKSRPVQTEHGPAAEAAVRKWLEMFLPGRYGVTSGFIIPNIRDVGEKLYHYDVIIYDQITAPVLWASENADQSKQGKFRAIPAKHVVSVYEVKASLTNANAFAAVEKLKELEVMRQHLPSVFSCGMVFVDLPPTHIKKIQILKTISEAATAPGFWGGTVLRTSCDPTMTGVLVIGDRPEGAKDGYEGKSLAKSVYELEIYGAPDGIKAGPGAGLRLTHIGPNTWAPTKVYHAGYTSGAHSMMCMWSHSGFADFAIHLLNALEGIPYWSHATSGRKFAQVFDRVDQRPASGPAVR